MAASRSHCGNVQDPEDEASAPPGAADLYGVLGLNRECTDAELRVAYRRLAMIWHPDRCSASGSSARVEEAKERFQEIQGAYSVLSDSNKRLLYDVGVYDSDDDEADLSGMGDFLGEMADMMSQATPTVSIYFGVGAYIACFGCCFRALYPLVQGFCLFQRWHLYSPFWLLFPCSAPAGSSFLGKMDAPLFLANLEKRREKKAITVRVVRKWTRIDNQGQGDPLYVGMVFTDAQGGAIYAEIPGKVVSLKEYLLDLGKVYNIKKFTVMNAKPNYKVVQGQLMIELSEFTTIELVRDPPPTIPEYCYSLSNFTSIVPPDGPLNQYTDVIGYVTKYTNLDTFVPKNKEDPVMLREIYIKDLRDNELKITIWGEHAVNFNLDHVYDRDVGNIVVCLLVGCTPHREYRDYNKIYLSGSTPFSYYLNPQIPDAAPYYSRFKDVSVLIDCPFAAQDIVPAQVQSVPRQMKTVADMNAIVDPFEFEDGTYKCQVTITSVVENMKWWYMSCRICKTKTIQQADRSYRCMNCNGTKVVARYLLSFWAKDDTAEGRFFAHDAEAKIIIGVDCESIMNPLGLAGNLPSQLLNIVNKKYTFSIDLDSGAIRQYVVKAVLEKPSKRPAQASGSTLMLQGSASHNAGASSSVIHIRSAHAEPAAPTEKTLTTPPPLAIQMTSAPVEAVDDTLENARYRRGTTARKNLAFPDNVQKEKDSSDQHASTNEETPSDDDHTNIVSGAETRSKRVRLSTAKGEPKQKNQKSAPSAPST